MSAKLTKKEIQNTPSAPITVLLQAASQWIVHALLGKLHKRGYKDITEAHIIFLGNLDCGATYASEIAKRMKITRQAIYRTVRELETLKILVIEQDFKKKNQKLIVMTEKGKELIKSARLDLEEIETVLASRIGNSNLQTFKNLLGKDWGNSP